MISRRTTRLIAEAYADEFPFLNFSGIDNLLYDNNYPDWFCNRVKINRPNLIGIKRVIKGLQTEQDKQRVEEVLHKLAEDIIGIVHKKNYQQYPRNSLEFGKFKKLQELIRSLELDGYVLQDDRLLPVEGYVIDIQQEQSALEALYSSLALNKLDVFREKLRLSEEHYLADRWSDAIHNSRLVLEGVLQEVAAAHSLRLRGTALPADTYTWPKNVRAYLESEGLLEKKEKEVIHYTYGLLSNTGSHPYMAEKDQARLLRQLALVFAQFVLLRFEGELNKKAATP